MRQSIRMTLALVLGLASAGAVQAVQTRTRASTEVRQGLPYNPLNETDSAQPSEDKSKPAPVNRISAMDGTTAVPRQSSDDQALNARVKKRLNTHVNSYDPQAHVIYSHGGEVTLEGIVRSQEEADRLQRETLMVRGVSKVNNKLVIESH